VVSEEKYFSTRGARTAGSLTCWKPCVVARTIAFGASSESTRDANAASLASVVGAVAVARAADC